MEVQSVARRQLAGQHGLQPALAARQVHDDRMPPRLRCQPFPFFRFVPAGSLLFAFAAGGNNQS
jgi:hypothetical protein